MPTRTRLLPGATFGRMAFVAALICAPTAHADLTEDLQALRAAHDAFVKRYTAPKSDPMPPAPSAWEDDNATCRTAWAKVSAFLDQAEKAYAESRDWQGAAAFGFSSDKAGQSEKSKGTMEARFEVGQYPDQFRLEAGASLDFDNQRGEEISEDVTRILLNYDHYFSRYYEGFGFIERFTDTFMSIDQRYEMGVGLKLEGNFPFERTRSLSDIEKYEESVKDKTFNKLDEERAKRDELVKTAQSLREVLEPGGKLANEAKCLVDTDWKALKMPKAFKHDNTSNEIYEYRDRQGARVELGISAAVLADFEQSDTLNFTTLIGAGPPVEQHFKPDGSVRYRLSIRPSLTWKINDELTFEGRFFYKPALDSPRSVNGTDDYRMDANASLRWKFGSIKQGSKKSTSLVLRYDWHYDSIPPNAAPLLTDLGVPPDQFGTVVVAGAAVAEKRHSQVRLLLEIGL